MSLYITADGGGTKLHVLAFDEALKPVGFGKSGGTNLNFIDAEQVKTHMREAIGQALGGRTKVDAAYATIVGDGGMFAEVARGCAEIGRVEIHSEPKAYLLAGALSGHALLALSGTGSGAGYILDGKAAAYVGGFGSTIGDDGSGWWIGSQGINAVIRAEEGWGEKTALSALLREYLPIKDVRDLIWAVYRDPRGSRTVAAGFCPMVGRAADAGDAVACRIVREAGKVMAQQIAALIRMANPPEDEPVVCCGGAWNSTPLFYGAFVGRLQEEKVKQPVHRALFSPALHGAVALLLEQGKNPRDYMAELQILQDCLK